jgi:hypothetical protein
MRQATTILKFETRRQGLVEITFGGNVTPSSLSKEMGNFYHFHFPDAPDLEIAAALGIIRE